MRTYTLRAYCQVVGICSRRNIRALEGEDGIEWKTIRTIFLSNQRSIRQTQKIKHQTSAARGHGSNKDHNKDHGQESDTRRMQHADGQVPSTDWKSKGAWQKSKKWRQIMHRGDKAEERDRRPDYEYQQREAGHWAFIIRIAEDQLLRLPYQSRR